MSDGRDDMGDEITRLELRAQRNLINFPLIRLKFG